MNLFNNKLNRIVFIFILLVKIFTDDISVQKVEFIISVLMRIRLQLVPKRHEKF